MRSRLALVVVAALSALGFSASAAPPQVAYRVEASAGSWRPITPSDLARVVEAAALEVISKPGRLQIVPTSPDGDGAAYLLRIRSHVLDEAETHTVTLAIGPGTEADLPSLSASRTVPLGGLPRGKMLERVEASARDAAAALVEALEAPLDRLAAGPKGAAEAPPSDLGDPPWQWAPVRIPKASVGRAERELRSKNATKRQAALRELTSLALTDAAPRHALERCALEHPDPRTRLGCLAGLRPLSRRTQPTARVVVEVFRKDADSKVRREANDQMLYFTGPGREAAVQAWLEAASAGKDAGPLEDLGDLPNLDHAIRSCLVATGKARAHSSKPRFRCIALLEPLPHARRRAILWPFLEEMDPGSPLYLEGAGEREGSTGTPWGRAVKAYLHGIRAWDRELEEILWQRYQRTLSATAMATLSGWAAPSPKTAERLVEIVRTKGEIRALNGLVRIAEDDAVRPKVKEALSEMLALGTHHKGLDARQIERALARIEREAKR